MSPNSFNLPVDNFFVLYYRNNGRYFPWRKENLSPFHSLITEMLLRQTQAITVSKIWKNFITKYPNPESIKNSDENQLKTFIKDLGLFNQRVKALNQVADWLINNFEGDVPSKLEQLMEGPHIGKYTAKAVRCFAFKKREEIVDVNILRFLARYFGKDLNSNDVRRNEWAWDIARSILPENNVIEHNYGLLDFCSNICTARNPKCDTCLLSTDCVYYQT